MSAIVDPAGNPHDVSPEDVLWLARALDGEGGDERRVATTLLQRWIELGGTSLMSLGDFVQSYSQPVNVIWTSTGAKCRPGGQYHGEPECAPDVTSRREQRRARSWNSLGADARDAAVWALYTTEAEDYAPASVHFATRALVARKLRRPSATVRREAWELLPAVGTGDGHSYLSTAASRAGRARIRVMPGPLDELDELGMRRAAIAPIPMRGQRDEGPSTAPLLFVVAAAGLGVAYSKRKALRL